MQYLIDVFRFHEKFGVPQPDTPVTFEEAEDFLQFRVNRIKAELDELMEAIERGDMEAVLDALVDKVYIDIGTALMLGLDFEEAWQRVHVANLQKARAEKDGSNSPFESKYDIVKPEGWTAPSLRDLVALNHRRTWPEGIVAASADSEISPDRFPE